MLQWIKIADLLVDPAYQRPIVGRGRTNVARIARSFRWTFFAPVVVSPVEGGRFAIIDGQHRTTAAALCGYDTVPCQVVIAAQGEQAAAFKAINGMTTPITPMALYAAALTAREDWALEITEICKSAEVSLLRYPLAVERQAPGQTMAVGALRACLRRHGRETLVLALRCVTQTHNNIPGVLSARMIKALCEAISLVDGKGIGDDRLIRAVDAIDLDAIQQASLDNAAATGKGPTRSLAEDIVDRLSRELRRDAA